MRSQRVGHNWAPLTFTVAVELLSCVSESFVTPRDCSLPGSSVHGISQARILEWLPFLPPGDLSDPETVPSSPALTGELFTAESPEINLSQSIGWLYTLGFTSLQNQVRRTLNFQIPRSSPRAIWISEVSYAALESLCLIMSQVILRFEQSLDAYESESVGYPVVFDTLQNHG